MQKNLQGVNDTAESKMIHVIFTKFSTLFFKNKPHLDSCFIINHLYEEAQNLKKSSFEKAKAKLCTPRCQDASQ